MTATTWSPHAAAPDPVQSLSMEALQWLLVFGGPAPGLAPASDRDDALWEATATSLAARDIGPGGIGDAEAVALLDRELMRALADGRRPLVLFSGGIDSSLVASRLKALGRHDALLVHFSFRPGDPETEAARAVAERLGLSLAVVDRSPAGELSCLEAPGQVYPFPFGDQSVPATRQLCEAVVGLASPDEFVVIDGTAADGAFGLAGRARQIERVAHPALAPVRAVAAHAYDHGLWRGTGRSEHVGRAVRRVHRLPAPLAGIAQDALDGVLFDAPDLPRLAEQWQVRLARAGAVGVAEQLVLTDLSVTCARIFAQKTLGPLEHEGFQVVYPFLSEALGSAGVRHTGRTTESLPKGWLRRALAEQLPQSLIDRPKSGLIDPDREMFDRPVFREALAEALGPDGTCRPLLRHARLARYLERCGPISALPHGHQNFLWTLAFTERWRRSSTGVGAG